jgi:hypothetical protein
MKAMIRPNKDFADYRKNKMEAGFVYQDFIVDLCWQTIGLAICQYVSKAYQFNVGESRTGVEIKHDMKYAETGNLYIETAEKARPRAGDYVPSGIYREDNTWLYIIGDYDTVFIFSKVLLRALHKGNRYREVEINLKTSKGYLLPDDHAKKYSSCILRPNSSEKVDMAIRNMEEIGKELHQLLMKKGTGMRSLFDVLDDDGMLKRQTA